MLNVILVSLFSCSLAVNLNTPIIRITGGDEATPHSYPFQVAIFIDKTAFCGGSLISPNYVLTAAHCATEIYSSAEIILGAHNISDTESSQVHITTSKIIIHKNYNDTNYQNDIALLRLSKPAPISEVIKTIPLPSKAEAKNTFVGKIVTSTGWGLTKDISNPSIKDMSSILRVVNVSVIELKTCKIYYKDEYSYINYITAKNICTSGVNKKGTCNGDSGGPLVLNGKQIGIVSAGSKYCEIGAPSVFTHIGKFLNWINKNSDVVIT